MSPTVHGSSTAVFWVRRMCAVLLAAIFFGFAALPVHGDAEIGFKYPVANTNYGNDDLMISSITIAPSKAKEGVGDPKFGELKAVLRVAIRKTDAYDQKINRDFSKVVKGEDPDTDSAQCAIKWTPGNNGDTNASAQGVRTSAATWHQDADGSMFWEASVPEGATHVEVVAIYTDVLYMSNSAHADTGSAKQRGDLPVIIASWSGDLQVDGTWKFTANLGDVSPRLNDYPTFDQIAQGTDVTKTVLKNKTGYTLYERPSALHDIPIREADSIQAAVTTAKNLGLINERADTGFDIIRD
jgi:hypothetical protein